MQISLPEPIFHKAERYAAANGFPTVGEYLSDLVMREEVVEAPFQDCKSEIEIALLAGVESGPATPFERADWDELKRRVYDVFSQKSATP